MENKLAVGRVCTLQGTLLGIYRLQVAVCGLFVCYVHVAKVNLGGSLISAPKGEVA